MQIRLKLDRSQLDIQVKRALGKSDYVKLLAYNAFKPFFQNAKRTMLAQFDRHPVTMELKEGPTATNISETLEDYPQGNLFSFIGFEDGAQPTSDLRDLIQDGTEFKQTVYKDGMWNFVVSTPTRAEIAGVTDMPWEQGNSWAFGVEQGIAGLSHYMYKKWEGGRSKEAFQLPYENMEDANFKTTPYITEILRNFRDRINNGIE